MKDKCFQLFVLINESHTETYRAQLGEEVGPQILELIERGEKGIKHLEKKAVLMKSKVLMHMADCNARPYTFSLAPGCSTEFCRAAPSQEAGRDD